MPGTESLIRELADRTALADLVARHSLWVDEHQYDETGRLFTDDVVVTSPRGQARGIEALIELVGSRHGELAATLHSKSNLVIDIDGDSATVRAHDVAVFAVDDKKEAIAAGVHHYNARRTGEGWRFDRLDIIPFALTESLERAL
ncbi:nuclear transport factor 2 family protein [Saccharomonospora sp. NPDC006951]